MSTVLIVDDSLTIRKMLIHFLKSDKHAIVEASNGIEALEKIVAHQIDLMVVDMNMPHMDGLELIKTIRQQPLYQDLPIIMLTTESSTESHREGFEAGANIYLTKPVQPHILLYKVKSLIN